MPITKTFAGVNYSLPLSGEINWGTDATAFLGSVADNAAVKGSIVNADISATAAIAYSKLSLSNSIVNADIAAAAAIAYSKLSLASSIVNADISGTAAIAYSKLSLSGSIVNADVSNTAAIAYSKLSLSGSIVNADVSNTAAIAYGKLSLTGSIVNADVANAAAIAYSKLSLSGSIVNADVSATAAIAYSKLSLSGSIVNADISATAGIVDTKLATISTAGKVSNSATTATDLNTASAIVARDASGNFSAGTITANLTGNVSGSAASFTGSLSGDVTGTQGSTAISSSTVTGKLITGFSSTTGALAGTDTILQAINKLDGNIGTKEPAITTLSAAKGGLGTNASAFTGVLKASSGMFNASTLVNADVDVAAAIARSKLASGTAGYVVINNPVGGAFSEEQYLSATRGGTGITSTATFPSSGVIVTEGSSSTLTNKTLTAPVITDYEDLTEIATPGSNPAAGKLRLYAKSDDKLYIKTSAGVETQVGTGGGGGSGTSLLKTITQTGMGVLATNPIGTPFYVDATSGWVKAGAQFANTAEIAGVMQARVDDNNATVAMGGEITGITSSAFVEAALPTKGTVVFLSDTAGKLTVTEPTVIGYVSKPIGIIHNVTAGVSVDMMMFNMRGTSVGNVNARTQVQITQGSGNNILNVSSMDAGEIVGWVYVNATTKYRFYVQAQWAKVGAANDWKVSVQTVGDVPPYDSGNVDFWGIDINSSGVMSMTLPTVSGFSSATFTYALNAPAVGTSLTVSASNVVGNIYGTAVPAGYIGELSTSVTANGVSVGTANYLTSSGLTLGPGNYNIFVQSTSAGNASVTGYEMGISSDSGSTTFSDRDLLTNVLKIGVGSGYGGGAQLFIQQNVTSSSTVYAKFKATGASETVYYRLRAIRIA